MKAYYKHQMETLALDKAVSEIKTLDTKEELDSEQGKGQWEASCLAEASREKV